MDMFKSNLALGVGVAVVATALAPVLIPVLATASRPLAKSLVKGGLTLYERGRETVAHAGEVLEDLIAEIHADANAEHQAQTSEADEMHDEAQDETQAMAPPQEVALQPPATQRGA